MLKRDRPRAGFWLRVCTLSCYPAIWTFFSRRSRHIERLGSGPAIVVANHISHIDPLLLAAFMWDNGFRPHFFAKASLFTVRPLLGRAFVGTGQIPVERGSMQAKESLSAAVATLRSGERVVIYPEGTVTRDPQRWPMAGKTGAARLALLTPDVPVIPVGQWGAHESVDMYNKRIRLRPRRKIGFSVGEPIDLSDFADVSGPDGSPTNEQLRAVTERFMLAIRAEVEELRGAKAPAAFYRRGTTADAAVTPPEAPTGTPNQTRSDGTVSE